MGVTRWKAFGNGRRTWGGLKLRRSRKPWIGIKGWGGLNVSCGSGIISSAVGLSKTHNINILGGNYDPKWVWCGLLKWGSSCWRAGCIALGEGKALALGVLGNWFIIVLPSGLISRIRLCWVKTEVIIKFEGKRVTGARLLKLKKKIPGC